MHVFLVRAHTHLACFRSLHFPSRLKGKRQESVCRILTSQESGGTQKDELAYLHLPEGSTIALSLIMNQRYFISELEVREVAKPEACA